MPTTGLPLRRRIAYRLIASSWEAFIGVSCLLGSLPRLFGTPAPQSVEAVFPQWLRLAWGVLFALSGLAVFVGIAAANPTLERCALWLLAGSTTAYAAAILGYQRSQGLPAAALIIAIAVTAVVSLARPRLLNWLRR